MSANTLGSRWLSIMELPKHQTSYAFSRTSLSWFYYFYGFIYGSWVSMIPTIVNYLGLSTVELGMILLLGGIGAMLGIPIVSNLILSSGSARSILSGVFAISCMLPIAGFPWFGIIGLSFGVLGVGIGSAVYDVSNNSHAVTLEKLLGENIIGSLQAINSFGNLCGVLCGGICGALHIPTFVFFAIVGAAGSSISMLFYQFLVDAETERGLVPLPTHEERNEEEQGDDDEEKSVEMIRSSTALEECTSCSSSPKRIDSEKSSERSPWLEQGVLVHSVSCHAKSFDDLIPPERRLMSLSRRERYHATSDVHVERSAKEPEYWGWDSRLVGLCFMGFMNFLGVGSVNNWSTVYFSGTLDTSPFFTTLGYAFFELFVMTGQISSDFFVMRFGPKNVLVFSGILAFVGISTVVYAPSNPFLSPGSTCEVSNSCTVVGIVGYSITGMGFSSIGPILISQTGKLNIEGMTPASQIGALTMVAYGGLLLGPVIFGGLSVLMQGLRWALLVGALMILSISPAAIVIFGQRHWLHRSAVSLTSLYDESVETVIKQMANDGICENRDHEECRDTDFVIGGYQIVGVDISAND